MAMWTMKDKPIQGFKEPENWSAEFNSFVQLCLKINPDERPNAEDLLHHDFIRKNSKGKRVLAQLVHNSMGEIDNFRAGQGPQEELDRNELKEMIFSKGDSNGSEYESKTVIVKGSDKKGSEVDSVIEHLGDSRSFKKQESDGSSHNKLLYEDDDENEDSGSVIVKDAANQDNGHSRNCSEISVSSVLVKDGN
jgi:serine/threonine protein kinase